MGGVGGSVGGVDERVRVERSGSVIAEWFGGYRCRLCVVDFYFECVKWEQNFWNLCAQDVIYYFLSVVQEDLIQGFAF